MINISKSVFVLMTILTSNGVYMNANSNEIKEINGIVAKYVQVACQEFEKKLNVNWEKYVVKVIEEDTYFVVNFRSIGVTPELRGSPKGVPGFEIKISKKNYEIIESQFIR